MHIAKQCWQVIGDDSLVQTEVNEFQEATVVTQTEGTDPSAECFRRGTG